MNSHVICFFKQQFKAMKADPKTNPMDLLKLAIEISKYLSTNA